jgi:hypothetical protein
LPGKSPVEITRFCIAQIQNPFFIFMLNRLTPYYTFFYPLKREKRSPPPYVVGIGGFPLHFPMSVCQSRPYLGSGSVAAIIVSGTRYGLRPDGRPEDPRLNQRACRRVRYTRERQVIPTMPKLAPVPSIDDFEPHLGADIFGPNAELWAGHPDQSFNLESFESANDRMDWDI